MEVVADVPGVGQNLQDHLGVYGLTWTIPNTASLASLFDTSALDDYVMYKEGPYSAPMGDYGSAWVKVMGGGDPQYPDIQLYLSPTSFHGDHGLFIPYIYGMDQMKYLSYYSQIFGQTGFTLMVSLLRPKSRGTITLKSSNPKDKPVIDPKFLSDKEDLLTLAKGVRFALQLGETSALKSQGATFYNKAVPGCESVAHRNKYFICYVQHMASSYWHPAGTCKMGPTTDPLAVVDDRLRVYRVSGLRVVDTSIMPVIVSGSTNIPTIMIAEKATDLIKSDWDVEIDV
ncbi:Glucose dehydrogenase [FAD quinone]-like 10, partial [Homarus americanus]